MNSTNSEAEIAFGSDNLELFKQLQPVQAYSASVDTSDTDQCYEPFEETWHNYRLYTAAASLSKTEDPGSNYVSEPVRVPRSNHAVRSHRTSVQLAGCRSQRPFTYESWKHALQRRQSPDRDMRIQVLKRVYANKHTKHINSSSHGAISETAHQMSAQSHHQTAFPKRETNKTHAKHDTNASPRLCAAKSSERCPSSDVVIYKRVQKARFAVRAKTAFVARRAANVVVNPRGSHLPSIDAASTSMNRREKEYIMADGGMHLDQREYAHLTRYAEWANYALEANEACLILEE